MMIRIHIFQKHDMAISNQLYSVFFFHISLFIIDILLYFHVPYIIYLYYITHLPYIFIIQNLITIFCLQNHLTMII